jgi:hypothetical protein
LFDIDISINLNNRGTFLNCFPGCRNSKTIQNFGGKIVFEFLQPGEQLRKDPMLLRLIEISITTNFLQKNYNTLSQLTPRAKNVIFSISCQKVM